MLRCEFLLGMNEVSTVCIYLHLQVVPSFSMKPVKAAKHSFYCTIMSSDLFCLHAFVNDSLFQACAFTCLPFSPYLIRQDFTVGKEQSNKMEKTPQRCKTQLQERSDSDGNNYVLAHSELDPVSATLSCVFIFKMQSFESDSERWIISNVIFWIIKGFCFYFS